MLFKQQARRLNHNCIFAFCVGNYFFLLVDFKLQLFNFDLETILDLITSLLTSMAAMVLVAVISFQFIAENFLWEQIAVINIFAKKKLFFPKHTIADHYKKIFAIFRSSTTEWQAHYGDNSCAKGKISKERRREDWLSILQCLQIFNVY